MKLRKTRQSNDECSSTTVAVERKRAPRRLVIADQQQQCVHRSPSINNAQQKRRDNLNIKWREDEVEALRIALKAALNPTTDGDWRVIASAVSQNGRRLRSGAECKAKAATDGLLLTTESGPPPSSSSGRVPMSHQRKTNSTHVNLDNNGRRQGLFLSNFAHDDYYNEFFAKQECPVTELDPDDSMMRFCYGSRREGTEFGPLKQMRRPKRMLVPVVEQLKPDSSSSQSDGHW